MLQYGYTYDYYLNFRKTQPVLSGRRLYGGIVVIMNEGKDCVDRWNEDEDCTCSVVPVAMTNGEMRRLVQFAKVCRLSAGELVRAFVADLLMLEDSKDEAAKRKAREWFVHRTTPIVNY